MEQIAINLFGDERPVVHGSTSGYLEYLQGRSDAHVMDYYRAYRHLSFTCVCGARYKFKPTHCNICKREL